MPFPNANFVRLDPALVTGSSFAAGVRFTFFRTKEHLKANGWTIERSGDGLSAFSAVGDVILSSAAGANGTNVTCWYVASNGDGQEIMRRWNTETAGSHFALSYSPVDGFTGGTATTAPTATDEGVIAANVNRGQLNPSTLRMKHFGYVENVSPYRLAFFLVADDSSAAASQANVPKSGWGRDLWRAYGFAADDAPDRSVWTHNEGGGFVNWGQGVSAIWAAYTDSSPPATSANFNTFDHAEGTTVTASGGVPFDTNGIATRELVLRRGGAFPVIPPCITWRKKNLADADSNAARVLEDEVEFGGSPGVFGDHVTLANLVIPWDRSVIWDDATVNSNRHYRSSTKILCSTTQVPAPVPKGIPEGVAGGITI